MIRSAMRTTAACGLLLLGSAAPAAAETVALVGGTVHTVSGAVLENATVVARDGRITAVGPGVSAPEGARVISCAGKHVYPGMIAANSVLGLVEVNSVRGTMDHQETGDVNPNIRAEVEVNPESDLIPVTRVNGITSALVAPRGGAIAGTSALIHLDGWTFEDMTVKSPVALHVQWPNMAPVRAFFETRTDEEQTRARDEAIRAIRGAFDDARAYWKAQSALGGAAVPRHDRDVKWEAMGRALRGEIPVMIHAATLAQIQAALDFVDQQKLTRVVLVGGDDAWLAAEELKKRDIAVITGGVTGTPRRRSDPYDQTFTAPARLQRAGLRFCISDGGSASGAYNTRNLPYHAAMAAAFGLPRDEALKAVTLYPAQILGVGDRLGSVEVGKIADLVVTDGDLLDNATQVERVLIAGREASMQNRQSRLFEKYDARPRGPKARKG